MNAQQRGPFEKRAKEEKFGRRKEVGKLTSQGIPVKVIENEKKQLKNSTRTMTHTIEDIVSNAFKTNCMLIWSISVAQISFNNFFIYFLQGIGSQEFFFISGNSFTNLDNLYLPAELAMVKFTFDSEIVSKFHVYVNPGKVHETVESMVTFFPRAISSG